MNLYRLRHTFFPRFFFRGLQSSEWDWTQMTHMSMYWHVMRQIPAFDCREVFHIEMTLVFLGCFVAMTSSRSPWLYFQFSMTETIGSYDLFHPIKKTSEQGSSIFHGLLFVLPFAIFRYLEFAAPPIWLRCSFFIYPAFLKMPPSEKIE